MRLSYNWLKELVDFDWSPHELADKLTMCGCEAERVQPLAERLEGVLVGKVERIGKHPSSCKLAICWVNVGTESLEVVCGAPNIRAGQTVPVALVGAYLPGGQKVKSGEIAGVESSGMICSEKELGLGEEKEGIMVLEDALRVGTPLMEALNLNDWILDIDLTPNRPDCLSMLGIAREVSALTGNPIRKPQMEVRENAEPAKNHLSIEIEDAHACPRYTARVVKNVKIAPSPFWLKRKLLAAGMRPVNNVVDVTNFVMMELGHPLHGFDYASFSTKKVSVRRAGANERFITLDGVERKLDKDMLLITDGKKGVAIAGIMGGAESEVTIYTKDVLLESAYFDPRVIRRGRMRLGISSEASYRFERGADPNITVAAADRAAELINQLAGGEVLKGAVDNYPVPIQPLRITLRPKKVNQLLSIHISKQEVSHILDRLELKTEDKEDLLEVEVPTFRPDLTREVDLIEEIARMYGYDKIGVSLNAGGPLMTEVSPDKKIRKKVKSLLVGKGFFEIVTSNLVHPQLLHRINSKARVLALRNPLSEELSVLATSLAYGMLSVIAHNKSHKQNDLKLFELSKVILAKEKDELPDERQSLCLALSGRRKPVQWGENYKEEVDLFDLKGIIEEMTGDINLSGLRVSLQEEELFEPNCCIALSIHGKILGLCGEVSRGILTEFGIKDKVFLAELDFDVLSSSVSFERAYYPLPKFPVSKRDLAIVVDQEVLSEDVERAIRTAGKEWVQELVLFDVYQGEQVPKGKKSLAYSISYRSSRGTLTDAEIETAHQNIVLELKSGFKAELRK